MTFKRVVYKVFAVRFVTLSVRTVSAVWYFLPALEQHFLKASNNETRQRTKKPHFKDYYLNYVQVLLKI